ncbi:MAG: adenine phosphoribosyltransferase [Nitrososphaerota archaeon]|nr:adenine phosphoribosyltransferase [Nitrososphaerota archaeon]MDG6938865.1 adenine phosphoribosyltransferase [Nitrososphaerota archaeon]
MDWLGLVKQDLLKARVVKIRQGRNAYDYIVNPLSSGVPAIPSEALWGCGYEVARMLDIKAANKIMAPEAMGFHIGASVSMVTGVPLLMIRKRSYFLPDEVKITKRTAYEESVMYINGVAKGEGVVLVDSIIATGGTLVAIIRALQKIGVKVVDCGVVIERAGLAGAEEVERETGVRVKTLLKVDVVDGKVVLAGET